MRVLLVAVAVFSASLGGLEMAFGATQDCHALVTCTDLQQDAAGVWFCAGTTTAGPQLCSTGGCTPCSPSGMTGGDPVCAGAGYTAATCKCTDPNNVGYAPCVTCIWGGPTNPSVRCVPHGCNSPAFCEFMWTPPPGGAGGSGTGHCVCFTRGG